MYCVQDAEFAETRISGRALAFKRLGTACPHCGRSAWFDFDPIVGSGDVNQAPRSVNCPGCKGVVRFFILSAPVAHTTSWLWADPSPATEHMHRGDIAAALSRIDPALREAYDEATTTLASGHASSATIQARRTLEGLVKHLLQAADSKVEIRGPLDRLIRDLTTSLDLAKPLTDTAHAVRQGGNLGAHYDARTIATKELANKTIDLFEAIADYLLVLPEKVEALRGLLERDPDESPSGGPESDT